MSMGNIELTAIPDSPVAPDYLLNQIPTSSWNRSKLSYVSRQLMKQGFAIIQPHAGLSHLLHTVSCSSDFMSKPSPATVFSTRTQSDVKYSLSPCSQARRHGGLRNCAVQSLIASCWMKAFGRDPSNCSQISPSDDLLSLFENWHCNDQISEPIDYRKTAFSLLKEHFPWVDESVLKANPTLQSLTDVIIQHEAAQAQLARCTLSGKGLCDSVSVLEYISSSRSHEEKMEFITAMRRSGVDPALSLLIDNWTGIAGPAKSGCDWTIAAEQLRNLISTSKDRPLNVDQCSVGPKPEILEYSDRYAKRRDVCSEAAAAAARYGALACRELDKLARLVLGDLGSEYLALLRDQGGVDGVAGVETEPLSVLSLYLQSTIHSVQSPSNTQQLGNPSGAGSCAEDSQNWRGVAVESPSREDDAVHLGLFGEVDVEAHCSGLLAIFITPPAAPVNSALGSSDTGPLVDVEERVRGSSSSPGGAAGAGGAEACSSAPRRVPAGSLLIVEGRLLEAVSAPPNGYGVHAGTSRRLPPRPRVRVSCAGANAGGMGRRPGIESRGGETGKTGEAAGCGGQSNGSVLRLSCIGDGRTGRWGRNSGGLLVYELHAHPGAVASPEEYGRMCLGKATPPLFRTRLQIRSVLASPLGRPSLARLIRSDLFPGLLSSSLTAEDSWNNDSALRRPMHQHNVVNSKAAGASEPLSSGSGCMCVVPQQQLVEESSFAVDSSGIAKECPCPFQRVRADAEADLALVDEWDGDGVPRSQPQTASTLAVDLSPGGCGGGSWQTCEADTAGCRSIATGSGASAGSGCLGSPDLACLVLAHLDVRCLCRASLVCRAWRCAGASSALWRFVDLSGLAPLVTDEALAMLASRLGNTRRLVLSGCSRLTDVGIESLLAGDPVRRGGGREEREKWLRECEAQGLPPEAYNAEVVVKGHRFRVYGFGRDADTGRAFVRGRTDEWGEVKVRAEHVRAALAAPPHSLLKHAESPPPTVSRTETSSVDAATTIGDAGGHASGSVISRPNTMLGGTSPVSSGGHGEKALARFDQVVMDRCRLMTIRSVRLLEVAAADLQGVPGPVTMCVEAEGGIAARNVIFFKIRRNQPLKRLLTSYIASAQLTYPLQRVEFRFHDAVVYAHDTALGLGLDDADNDGVDVPRFIAVLPRIRLRVFVLPLNPSSPVIVSGRLQQTSLLWGPGAGAEFGAGPVEGTAVGPCGGVCGTAEVVKDTTESAAAAAKAGWYGGGGDVYEHEMTLRGSERLDALDALCRARARAGQPLCAVRLTSTPPSMRDCVHNGLSRAASDGGVDIATVSPLVFGNPPPPPAGPAWRTLQMTIAQVGWADGQLLWSSPTAAPPNKVWPSGGEGCVGRAACGRRWQVVRASDAWFVPAEWNDAWFLVAQDRPRSAPQRNPRSLMVEGRVGPSQLVAVVFGVFAGVGAGPSCSASARLAAMVSAAAASDDRSHEKHSGDQGSNTVLQMVLPGSESALLPGDAQFLFVDLRHVLPRAGRTLRVTPTTRIYEVSAAEGAGAVRELWRRESVCRARLVAVVEGADEAALGDAFNARAHSCA